jgi:hypothetical protein
MSKSQHFERILRMFESSSPVPEGTDWCDIDNPFESGYHFTETGERNELFTERWWGFYYGYFAGHESALPYAEDLLRFERMRASSKESFCAKMRADHPQKIDESEVIYVS